MLLGNAGFTAAPSEVAQEQKLSSHHRLDQEFEVPITSNYLIFEIEKLQRKTFPNKGGRLFAALGEQVCSYIFWMKHINLDTGCTCVNWPSSISVSIY